MIFISVVGIIFALLFGIAFMTRRRFGVLGLALVAGALMAELWAAQLTPVVANAGISLIKPPLVSVVALVLTLMPACLLLFSGPAVYRRFEWVGGALLFALLSVTLMEKSLADALVIEGPGIILQKSLETYSPIIVTVCVFLAVLDVLMTHTARPVRHRDKKHA